MGWGVYAAAMLFCGVVLRTTSLSFDFRTFYAAGVLVRTDPAHLYDLAAQQQVQNARVSVKGAALPFLHPSYEALVDAAFAWMPYRAAYLSFMGFNLLLVLAAFFVGRGSGAMALWPERAGAVMFLFVPLLVTVWQGQDSILFLLVCCLAWRKLEEGHDARAGVALALGLFKFQLAIPMAVVLVARRGWRFAAGFAAAGAGVAAACFAMVGRAGSAVVMRLLVAGSLAHDQGAAAQQAMVIKPTAMPNLVGLLYSCGTRSAGGGGVCGGGGGVGWGAVRLHDCGAEGAHGAGGVCAGGAGGRTGELPHVHLRCDAAAGADGAAVGADGMGDAGGAVCRAGGGSGAGGTGWIFLLAVPMVGLAVEAGRAVCGEEARG